MTMQPPIIDSHLHLWKLSEGAYPWLTPDVGVLHQDFTALQAKVELDRAGVSAAILVQADDTLADTEWLLANARVHPWILGVVGWIQLDDPSRAESQLEQWQHEPFLVGLRHLVHNDPRDNFLSLPAVRQSLSTVAAAGLPFDIPDAFPRHLGAAAELARAVPALTVVVDHLGKPPLTDPDAYPQWKRELTRCAELPNTVAKLSGLHIPGKGPSQAAIERAVEAALELFGADRLMYGGDWPMSVPTGGYQPTWEVLRGLVAALSAPEQQDILSTTAARTYLSR